MKVTVLDKEIRGLECFDEGNEDLFDEWMSVLTDNDIVEVYFVNVSDETFKKFEDEGYKRVFVSEDEVKKYVGTSTYVFVFQDGRLKLCFMTSNSH